MATLPSPSWVLPGVIERAEEGILVNSEPCIQRPTDVDNLLTQLLREARQLA